MYPTALIAVVGSTNFAEDVAMHAFGKDVLADHDAVALAQLIRRRDISASEVITAAIARAEKVATLNAVEIPLYDEAKAAAKDILPAGFFSGVPTFIKDNAELKGQPTRSGSRAGNPKAAKAHGPFTEQYLQQGFLVLGKSTLPEFGFIPSTEYESDPPTRNPWNTEYSPGGSSGGSAALVAAGVIPIAHANDGGGSIRIPAACCGLVGLKPTRGRHLNNASANAMPINLVGEGVVTRSVRDTAQFFYELERTYQNPKLLPIGRVEGPGKKRLRIGLVLDSITGTRTDKDTRACVEKTAKLMQKLGHDVVPMPLDVPESFMEDFIIYWSMLAFLISTFGSVIVSRDFDGAKLDPFTRGLVANFRKRMLRVPAALLSVRGAETMYKKLVGSYDAVLSPVLGHVTPKLGYLKPDQDYDTLMERLRAYVSFTPLNNAAGSPAISLPMGLSSDGLPIGVQFQAAHGNERLLLEIAFELEAANPWPKITGK